METELKLQCLNGAYWEKLREGKALAEWVLIGSKGEDEMEAYYFDTPDLALNRAGLAYRVRREGGRWVAAVKDGGKSGGGLHRRQEWSLEVASPQPDIKVLKELEVWPRLKAAAGKAELKPIVITRFQRFWLEVDTPDGSRVELAFDKGVIIAGDKQEPIMEVELELLEGNSAVLLELGAMLAKDCGLRPESRSKYHRGLQLAGLAMEKTNEEFSVLSPQEACGKAVKEIVIGHVFKVWELAKSFMEEPERPENVHHLRVGIRRLRSMLALAKPFLAEQDYERFTAELAQLAGSLGRLREMDAALEVLKEDNETLRDLRMSEARQRQGDFYRGIDTPVLLELWSVLEESDWLDEGGRNLKDFAAARIDLWLQKLMNESREAIIGDSLENPRLHKLRVRAKRTRYVWEMLHHIWPQENGAMRRGLIKLQDNLGTICDASGADRLWHEALIGQSDPQVYYAAGRIAGWQEARAGAAGKELVKTWRKLRQAVREWEKIR